MKRLYPSRHWMFPVMAALSSGAMYFFSTGLVGFRPLIWIAPVPVLLVSTRSSRRMASAVAFGAYFLGGLNLAGYLGKLAPIGVVAGSLVLPAAAFALSVIAYRDAILHLRHPLSFAAFPVGWTAYEFLLSNISPHGTAGSIAYTQSDLLPLVQISSLTGFLGITFILTLVPAALAVVWHHREKKSFALIALAIAFIISSGSAVYGWMRLREPAPKQQVRVGVAAIDSMVRYFKTTDRAEALNVLEAYARVISKLADQGARIVVLPEKLVGVTREYEDDAFKILSESAQKGNVFVVAGFNLLGSNPRNMAVLFSADGNLLAEYDKVFPIPGIESEYRRGTKILQFSALGLTGGIAICKDMDFPRWINRYGAAGVGMLFVPAWDFTSDAWLHSRMAIMRGVENGFAIVRSANDGFLTVTDDRGRTIGEVSSSRASAAVLLSDVGPGSGHTLYAMVGDWFGWTNLFFLLILIVAVSRRLGRRLVQSGNRTAADRLMN